MSELAKMIAIAKKFGGGSPTPAPVVILPETELMTSDVEEGSNGQYVLLTPLENTPSVGGTYKMVWGGVEYTSKAVEVQIASVGVSGIALGNTDYMGLDDVENPGADMPILAVLFPDGFIEDPSDPVMYCMAISIGVTPNPPVLSIVQTGGASEDSGSDGGGVFTARFTASSAVAAMELSDCDKSVYEFDAAYKAGKDIRIVAVVDETQEYIGRVVRASKPEGDTWIIFNAVVPFGTGSVTNTFTIFPDDTGMMTATKVGS